MDLKEKSFMTSRAEVIKLGINLSLESFDRVDSEWQPLYLTSDYLNFIFIADCFSKYSLVESLRVVVNTEAALTAEMNSSFNCFQSIKWFDLKTFDAVVTIEDVLRTLLPPGYPVAICL